MKKRKSYHQKSFKEWLVGLPNSKVCNARQRAGGTRMWVVNKDQLSEKPRRNDPCQCGLKEEMIDIEKLYSIYSDGKTLQEIGDLVGVSNSTVSRWFKKHGFVTRSKSKCATGELNASFIDGPIETKDGYITVWDGEKRILEHRFVMEQNIGRTLTSKEIVHHIDGDKKNNDINNLKLVSNQEHRKEHKLPEEQWSRHYDSCIKCGDDTKKHAGKGLCTRCHQYVWSVTRRGYEVDTDEYGKRIFSDSHRKKLKEQAILREFRKKYKLCCREIDLKLSWKNNGVT